MGASERFFFRVEISYKLDISREDINGLKKLEVSISILAVNGCQSKGLVVRNFKIDCQGFVFGYDTEITIPIFFVYN